jgi:hypothetical protein
MTGNDYTKRSYPARAARQRTARSRSRAALAARRVLRRVCATDGKRGRARPRSSKRGARATFVHTELFRETTSTERGAIGDQASTRHSRLFANGARVCARSLRRGPMARARARSWRTRRRAPHPSVDDIERNDQHRADARAACSSVRGREPRSRSAAKRCSQCLMRNDEKSVARIFSTAAAREVTLAAAGCLSNLSLLTVLHQSCLRSERFVHACTCGGRAHLLCSEHSTPSCAV